MSMRSWSSTSRMGVVWMALAAGLALAAPVVAQKGGGGGGGSASRPGSSTPTETEGGEKKKLEVGSMAPRMSVDEWVQGDRVPKIDEGKVYVVEFWATWCAPCRKAIPHINELYNEHKNDGLTVLGIAASERGSKTQNITGVREFVKNRGDGMAYTVGVDNDGSMNRAWMKAAEQNGIPTAFVVSRDGKITYIGSPLDEAFDAAVKSALGVKPGKGGKDGKAGEKGGKPRADAGEGAGGFELRTVEFSPPAPKAPVAAKTLREGDAAPELSTDAWISGSKVAGFEPGKVYVVDFWATWCKPCIGMMPELSELQKKYSGQGLTVIGVAGDEQGKNMREKVDALRSWVKKNESTIQYPIAFDNNASMRKDWLTASGRSGLPTAFVIDRQGRVSHIASGAPMVGLEEQVRRALGLKTAAAENVSGDGPRGVVLASFEQPAAEATKQPEAKKDDAKKDEKKEPKRAEVLKLAVGDTAPAINVGSWVKGQPVTGFEKGRTYVVEFWATWCGPCRDSIPHLTELQKKHKDVTFIGVSVWERDQAAVEPFVKAMGEKMEYRVAMDSVPTPADDTPRARSAASRNGAMARTWMQASGAQGIPTAFIVNGQGKVAWMGHPMEMDQPLAQVIAKGSVDEAKEPAKSTSKLEELMERSMAAERAGDVDGQLKALDEIIAMQPTMTGAKMQKFRVLLNGKKDYAAASVVGNELVAGPLKDNAMGLNEIAWSIVDPEAKVGTKDLKLAATAAERAAELTKRVDPAILDTLATVQFESGDIAKAIETQTLAVEKAKGTEMHGELADRLQSFKKAKKS